MIIGVISDTHGYYHPAIDQVFSGVDHILHAGDIGKAEVLDLLRDIAPVTAVYGNIDGPGIRKDLPEIVRTELEGVTFVMTHIAGRPGKWQRNMDNYLRDDTPDVFVCGHSHILQMERVEELDDMLFLNPGAAGKQGLHTVKTCVRINATSGKLVAAEVIHLDED